MSLRNEVPQRAFINAQIVQLAEKEGDWRKAVSSIAHQYNLDQYQFMNPSYMVSLLYCLLVVPKEIWIKKDKSHEIFKEIDHEELKKRIKNYTSTISDFDNDFVYNFINKLRNAISHANYEIDQNMNFEFWDIYKGKENFRCQVNAENLMWLLSIIGAKLANLRLKA